MLKIIAIGFEISEETFIKTTVALATGLDVGAWGYVDRLNEADVVLINMVSDRGAAAFLDYSSASYNLHPRVIPCTDDPAVADAHPLTLKLPLTYSGLIELLLKLQNDQAYPIESTSLGNDAEENGGMEPQRPRDRRESEEEVPSALAVGDESDSARGEEVPSLVERVTNYRFEHRLPSRSDETDQPAETRERTPNESGGKGARFEDADTIDKPLKTQDDPEMSRITGDADTALATQALVDRCWDDNSRWSDADASLDNLPQETAEPEFSRLLQRRDDTEQSHSGPVCEEPVQTVSARKTKAVAVPITSNRRGMRADGYDEQMLARDRPARKFFKVLRFLGIVRDAMERGQVVEINHEQFPPVWIFPERQLYVVLSDTPLKVEMFRTLASEFSVRPVARGRLRRRSTDWQIAPLWRLLYIAALYGSEGRLKESAHYTDRLHLIAEPDFSVVPCVAEHRRIATYMLAKTADVATIAAAAGVSIAMVIDFSNACDEVLLIERTSLPTDEEYVDSETMSQGAGKHKRLGLLGSLESLFSRSS